MIHQKQKTIFRNYLFTPLIILGLVFNLSFTKAPAGAAPGTTDTGLLRQVRVMEIDRAGLHNPAGLTFSAKANAFQVLEENGQGQPTSDHTDFVKLTPFSHRAGSARIMAAIHDPINVAYDNSLDRLLILQASANQLLEVREDSDGNLDPATLTRYDARAFGLQDPEGMSVDPVSGVLYILDAVGPRIVEV